MGVLGFPVGALLTHRVACEGLRTRGYLETAVERAREGLEKGAEIFAPFVTLFWREARDTQPAMSDPTTCPGTEDGPQPTPRGN